jgi:hypothetical protein
MPVAGASEAGAEEAVDAVALAESMAAKVKTSRPMRRQSIFRHGMRMAPLRRPQTPINLLLRAMLLRSNNSPVAGAA